MANSIVLTPPPLPAQTNSIYANLLSNLSGKRSVYAKDQTAIGLRTTPVTVTGIVTGGTFPVNVDIFAGQFGNVSAFLTTVASDNNGNFSVPVTLSRGVNFIQAAVGSTKSNFVTLQAYNLHLWLEAWGAEYQQNLLVQLEQAISDQNIGGANGIISGSFITPSALGLRDNLGTLVSFKFPSLFDPSTYISILRTILQRIVPNTTTVDAPRELFRAFTGRYPFVQEFYRRFDFLLSNDLNVSVIRTGASANPSLLILLSGGTIHIGPHNNLRTPTRTYALADNSTNYLVADGSFNPGDTTATVFVTTNPVVSAYVQIPDVDPRFQFQMRLSLSDQFNPAFGDTGWLAWAPSFFLPLTVSNPYAPVFVKFMDINGVESPVQVTRAEVRVFATLSTSGGDTISISGNDILGSDGPIGWRLRDSQHRFQVTDLGPNNLTSDQKTELLNQIHRAKPIHNGCYVKFADEASGREV